MSSPEIPVGGGSVRDVGPLGRLTVTVVLVISALLFGYIAVNAIFNPNAAHNAGWLRLNAHSQNEFIANYGGMHVAFSAISIAGLFRDSLKPVALWMLGLVCGGLLAGRLWSLVVDGNPGGFAIALIILEAVAAGFAFGLLWAMKRASSSRASGARSEVGAH